MSHSHPAGLDEERNAFLSVDIGCNAEVMASSPADVVYVRRSTPTARHGSPEPKLQSRRGSDSKSESSSLLFPGTSRVSSTVNYNVAQIVVLTLIAFGVLYAVWEVAHRPSNSEVAQMHHSDIPTVSA
jgi:hypothetical protein